MKYRITHYRLALVKDRVAEYELNRIDSPEASSVILRELLRDIPYEQIYALYLNAQLGIVGSQMIAQGGLRGCSIMPREVFSGALVANASAIVLGHNHPSGDTTPSDGDLKMTDQVVTIGKLLDIHVLDHIIVSGNAYTSMRDLGVGGLDP